MERALIEYIANALWQIPLLAVGAWLLLRATKPGPLAQHCLWLGVLALAVLLPMRGIGNGPATEVSAERGGANVQNQMTAAASPADSTTTFAALSALDAGASVSSLDRTQNRTQRDEGYRLRVPLLVRNFRLSAAAAHCLTALYLIAALIGLVRITVGWRTAQALVRQALPVTLPSPHREELAQGGRRLGVRVPEVRESGKISTPVVAGVSSPVLLVPVGFEEYSPDEIKAAIHHELAHLRRHDYLVNLICHVGSLPVAWHPAAYAVQERIQRTREMVCDAIAAREMCSEIGYARCLVAMAKSMLHGQELTQEAQGIGLFSKNILEERVMRLMEKKPVVSVREKVARITSGATVMAATILVAAVFHVAPTMAAEQQVQDAQNTPQQIAPQAIAPDMSSAPQSAKAPAAAVQPRVHVLPLDSATHVAQVAPIPPTPPIAPVPPVAPVAPVAPIAPVGPIAQVAPHVHEHWGPTSEEERKIEKAFAEASKKLSEAQTSMFKSPEFKRQIEESKHQIAEAQAMLKSEQFKKQIQDAKCQAADARMRGEEIKKQMAELQTQLQSDAFKRQIEFATESAIHKEEFKREMEKAAQEIKKATEEFKKQQIEIHER